MVSKRDRSQKLTVIGYKRIVNKKVPLISGMKRVFFECNTCNKKTYLDSESLPLSTPVITTHCSHSFNDYKTI